MITAEEVVNTILNVNEDDENVGEGVPSDADVMVLLEDGTIISAKSLQWEPETNTLWIRGEYF